MANLAALLALAVLVLLPDQTIEDTVRCRSVSPHMRMMKSVRESPCLLLSKSHCRHAAAIAAPWACSRFHEEDVTSSAKLLRLRGGGVPKFYGWLSERYPLINHDVTSDVCMPTIDNLYLDMNGIIHPCTHGNSEELVDLTQNEMFLKIFAFLDQLVHLVRPQQILFLAVDGVAPRAKMNQQRARRFKAAKDLGQKMEKARESGSQVPAEPFDSNCITPGTQFMADLSECLHHYIRYKVGCDATWKAPSIILSGHEVPGEGEHKIMEYIRREKMQAGYPPNMRHCIYGNDADLIMLALASHEPHFVLLRQKEYYQPPRRGKGTLNKAEAEEKEKSKGWQLMHVSVLRDYLHLEMQVKRSRSKLSMKKQSRWRLISLNYSAGAVRGDGEGRATLRPRAIGR